MRKLEERNKLIDISKESKTAPNKIRDWKSPKGEYFLYEDEKLIEYTDTRVINHLNDRLVNLAETPFEN